MAKDPSKFLPQLRTGEGGKENKPITNPDEVGKRVIDPNQIPLSKVREVETIDQLLRISNPMGSFKSAGYNMLYGINHVGVDSPVGSNRDSYGLTFFTRPLLNLSTFNLRNDRKMYSLLTTDEQSIHRWARCTLDPRLAYSAPSLDLYNSGKSGDDAIFTGNLKDADKQKIMEKIFNNTKNLKHYELEAITTPLVDTDQAFIPILTNSLKSLNGWPDSVVQSYVSKPGVRQEQWGMVDSHMDVYQTFDLDCNFENMKDEPLILLFETWLRYMSNVYEGLFSPYMDFIVENEIDYNTRIYRLVLDETRMFVKKISACGAAYPVSVPNGKFFDYDRGPRYNTNNKDINIRFTCFGAMYNDDILVKEFNYASSAHNMELWELARWGELKKNSTFVEVPVNILHLLNFKGYPIIDEDSLRLRWFVKKDDPSVKEILNFYGPKTNPKKPTYKPIYT